MKQDKEHLKILSIFHYVLGGMMGIFALFPIFHLIFGLIFIFIGETSKSGGPPVFIGFIFVFMALLFITIGWILAACLLFTGRFLSRHKNYTFCLVIAAIECMFMPFGTVLGVFTIIVLMRESVKELFSGQPISNSAKSEEIDNIDLR